MRNSLIVVCDWIDVVNRIVGEIAKWAALAMVIVQFSIVMMRYILGENFVSMQEMVLYLNATLFMLGAGYTLLSGGHVRVDIFYSEISTRAKAVIDICGVILLLVPFCLVTLWFSWPYVFASWRILEGALYVGGLPAVFLLKSLILAFAALILVQGISMALRAAISAMRGDPAMTPD